MTDNLLTTKEAIKRLTDKVASVKIPENLNSKLQELFDQLEINSQNEESFWPVYQNTSKYIDWIIAVPWFNQTKDILDLNYAKEKLNEEHFGLETIKERILEYISVMALQKSRNPNETVHAPVLLFVGLVGTGKTTMAKSIAKVLGRELIRIPFGGLGDANYLRGHSRINPDNEPGQIIKGLVNCKSNNPVILLDEIDRVADDALNTIMGVLVEILDPEQNSRFVDHYLDYPVDLSQAIFCATCNNTSRIATAVLDRLEVIQMPSYTDDEKITIAKDYLLPRALKANGLTPEDLKVSADIWPQIVRPLGFDAGVRTLQRNIEGMCRKVAKIILEGKTRQVAVDESNIKTFLPQW
ncbi:MAG: AAA family ATPase [Candidatus Shapirobacteria bacterium]|nr:AAA family ATPase [Candidatus Shapirobacteria bacterium]MDD3002373.1 AAA family ATPase [Candidatus Shapirobacteria bacterium]MDD4383319.1 AAA family ATPase [Candidatus Shapirobacteria bacterium]